MDEIKLYVKDNQVIQKELYKEVKEIMSQNLVTRDSLLQAKTVECRFQSIMIKLAGEELIELEEEVEKKDIIIDEYKKHIGDNTLNKKILEKANITYNSNFDPSKLKYKEKSIARLNKRLQNLTKQIKQ